MVTDAEIISRNLLQYRNFEECVLVGVGWKRFGVNLDFSFDYAWEGDDIRHDISEVSMLVTLRTYLVQEMHLNNAISNFIARNSEEVNWGFSEVAQVVLVEGSSLASTYSSLDMEYHHLAIEWEGERRIDLIMAGIDILAP
jgi:hypothetical protein